MAKIIIAGDAMIVESAHTLDQIRTLEKHRPKALALYDEDGKNEVFRVGTTNGEGNIGCYGASFGSSAKNEGKKAVITMTIPADVTDAKKYAEDTVGVAIINLNRVEAKFADALKSIEEEKATVRNNIQVI